MGFVWPTCSLTTAFFNSRSYGLAGGYRAKHCRDFHLTGSHDPLIFRPHGPPKMANRYCGKMNSIFWLPMRLFGTDRLLCGNGATTVSRVAPIMPGFLTRLRFITMASPGNASDAQLFSRVGDIHHRQRLQNGFERLVTTPHHLRFW